MSLEGMARKAKRQIKKRDARLAAEGTSAADIQAKKNEEHQRIAAGRSLSMAQQRAASAPPIRSKGDDSLKTGDSDLEVQNDSGFGTHTEYPGYKCVDGSCSAAFHAPERLKEHKLLYHAPGDLLWGE
jgi:hypothetical protein